MVSLDELMDSVRKEYDNLCENYSQDVYWLLRGYRVKVISDLNKKIISAIIAYHKHNIHAVTYRMLNAIICVDDDYILYPPCHKLGDLKVILTYRQKKGRYTFRLDPMFEKTINEKKSEMLVEVEI